MYKSECAYDMLYTRPDQPFFFIYPLCTQTKVPSHERVCQRGKAGVYLAQKIPLERCGKAVIGCCCRQMAKLLLSYGEI